MDFGRNYENKVQTLLSAVVATGASLPVALPPGRKMFHISMASGTATVTLRGSVDGTNWTVLHSQATSSGVAEVDVEFDDIYPKHSANVSAWTSGAISVTVSNPAAK
jgi:hypothetical protein